PTCLASVHAAGSGLVPKQYALAKIDPCIARCHGRQQLGRAIAVPWSKLERGVHYRRQPLPKQRCMTAYGIPVGFAKQLQLLLVAPQLIGVLIQPRLTGKRECLFVLPATESIVFDLDGYEDSARKPSFSDECSDCQQVGSLPAAVAMGHIARPK